MTKATAVNDAAGRPQFAVNVIQDVTDVKRAELDQAFLARASELLAASLDVEHTLTQVAQLAVPRLCDWCSVALPDSTGRLQHVAIAHRDPERLELARAYEERHPVELDADLGSARVMRSGRPLLANDITDELLAQTFGDGEQRAALREVGIRSAMIVPMATAGRIVGTMTFIGDNAHRSFSDTDLRLAEELARRAGTAIANAQLYSQNVEIAETLQQSLLPRALPEIPRFTLGSAYAPAGDINIVGGDFYDVAATDEGWMILIGTSPGAARAPHPSQPRLGTRCVSPRRCSETRSRRSTISTETCSANHIRRFAPSPSCTSCPPASAPLPRSSAPATHNPCSCIAARQARSASPGRSSAPGLTASGRLIP